MSKQGKNKQDKPAANEETQKSQQIVDTAAKSLEKHHKEKIDQIEKDVKDRFMSVAENYLEGKTIYDFTPDDIKSIASTIELGIKYEEETKVIKENFNAAMQVAKALYAINTTRLYRLKYKTFAEYVEKEFDFSKARAYQLYHAHRIADIVNRKLNKPIITNESQARELLRLRCFKDEAKDEDASDNARIKFIEELIAANVEVTAKVLSDKVTEKMGAVKAVRFDHLTLVQDKTAFRKSLDQGMAQFTKRFSREGISEEEKKDIKKMHLRELRALIRKIEKYTLEDATTDTGRDANADDEKNVDGQ